jgi:hypothetical protein
MPFRSDPRDANSAWAPWTMIDFKTHLSGQRSYGHYMLDENNNTKLFAYDLDIMQPTQANGFTWRTPEGELYNPREVWVTQDTEHPMYLRLRRQLRTMAQALCTALNEMFGDDVRVAVCDTGGKGLHVYGFYGLMPASVARQVSVGMLEEIGGFTPRRGDNFFFYDNPENPDALDCIEVEVFPKQDELTDGGLGNLMALPCGKNVKTGRERPFVTFADLDLDSGWKPIDPIDALTAVASWR